MKYLKALIALTVISLAFLPQSAKAQFTLPQLSYGYDALEPHIDSTTMRIHYNNHHKAYVNNLNTAVGKHKELEGKSVEQLVQTIGKLPSDVQVAIRNNGGGHYNHTLFWSLMTPANSTGKISTELDQAIVATFGSVDNMKLELEKAGMTRFGSGWAWLVVDAKGKLKIGSTPNQDNPLMKDAPIQGTPILALDVWEHAYYLKYQSARASYCKAFWNVVNWNKVSELYKATRK